jgi:hypothetical protein
MVLLLVSWWWWSCCFCLAENATTNHRQALQRRAAAGDESIKGENKTINYRIDRGLRNTSRQISFEFLFIKTCLPDKLHNGFGFVIQFRVGIRYRKCEGGEF